MIPKVIHYCWFGGNPFPELVHKCIASWKMYCPDYEIKEWNESNFDINCCNYVKEAYEAKKWAFVSDYARLKIIYEQGGIYLDTDVQLVKPLDDLLNEHCYLGEETTGYVSTGLGFGAEKENFMIKEMLREYENKHFKLPDGSYEVVPCIRKNTEPLLKYGYRFSGTCIWKNENVTVYPPEYFCPLNYETQKIKITSNTYSIHLFNASWHSKLDKIIISLEYSKKGKNTVNYKINRVLSLPFRVVNKIAKNKRKIWGTKKNNIR